MGCAGSLVKRGCKVTLITSDNCPLERLVGNRIGGAIGDFFERKGVKIRTGTRATRIDPGRGSSNRSVRVVLNDKEDDYLPAEVVVVGAGIEPNSECLREVSGLHLDLNKGVLVDSFFRTSVPDIYAAGDLASVISPTSNNVLRVEHWHTACTHGRQAARSMLDLKGLEGASTVIIPFFWTVLCGRTLKYVGHVGVPLDECEILVQGDVDKLHFVAYICGPSPSGGDRPVLAVVSMGVTEPICIAAGELMKRGKMLSKREVLDFISPVDRLKQLNQQSSVTTSAGPGKKTTLCGSCQGCPCAEKSKKTAPPDQQEAQPRNIPPIRPN